MPLALDSLPVLPAWVVGGVGERSELSTTTLHWRLPFSSRKAEGRRSRPQGHFLSCVHSHIFALCDCNPAVQVLFHKSHIKAGKGQTDIWDMGFYCLTLNVTRVTLHSSHRPELARDPTQVKQCWGCWAMDGVLGEHCCVCHELPAQPFSPH